MRRFLFLALLVLALPGCAAHKVTARDSFFSVSKDGNPVVSVTLDEGFVFVGQETEKLNGRAMTQYNFRKGDAHAFACAVDTLRDGDLSKEEVSAILRPEPYTYRRNTPSIYDSFSFKDAAARKGYSYASENASTSFDYLRYISTTNAVARVHAFFLPNVFMFFGYLEHQGLRFPANESDLTQEHQAILEHLSRQADAAFQSIHFAQ